MTNTIKYSLGVLGLLIILFLTNQRSQNSYNIEGEPIYTGSDDNVHRILFTETDKMLELVRSDTTWGITQADSFEVKENQVEKIFDRLLKVEQEMLISSKPEKWSKFGVDDSLRKLTYNVTATTANMQQELCKNKHLAFLWFLPPG